MDGLLVARAPLLIIFGNLNGLVRTFERLGGTTISTTVGHYVYAMVNSKRAQVMYGGRDAPWCCRDSYPCSKTGDLATVVDSIVDHFNLRDELALSLVSQVTVGRSLGVVGSAAIAAIKALAFCCGLDLRPLEVAEIAVRIGDDRTWLDVGLSELYATALGGINRISSTGRKVIVEQLVLDDETGEELEEGLMLFALENSKPTVAPPVAALDDPRVEEQLEKLIGISQAIGDALHENDLDAFGELLDRSWTVSAEIAKRDPFLERCYRTAREHGALGGDWSGGPEGGFLMLYCPDDSRAAVTWAMNGLGLRRRPWRLECDGVRITPMRWSSMTAHRIGAGLTRRRGGRP